MAKLTKAQLLALGEANDVDLSEATTNDERADILTDAGIELYASDNVNPERRCPNCGELHASSIVPVGEMGLLLENGIKLTALPPADFYRVFVCNGHHFAVVHEGGEAE